MGQWGRTSGGEHAPRLSSRACSSSPQLGQCARLPLQREGHQLNWSAGMVASLFGRLFRPAEAPPAPVSETPMDWGAPHERPEERDTSGCDARGPKLTAARQDGRQCLSAATIHPPRSILHGRRPVTLGRQSAGARDKRPSVCSQTRPVKCAPSASAAPNVYSMQCVHRRLCAMYVPMGVPRGGHSKEQRHRPASQPDGEAARGRPRLAGHPPQRCG